MVASFAVASIEPEEAPDDAPDEAPLDEEAPDDVPPPDAAPDELTSLVASPGPALPPVDELLPQPTAVRAAPINATVVNVRKRTWIFIAALLGLEHVAGRQKSAEMECSHPCRYVATGNFSYQPW